LEILFGNVLRVELKMMQNKKEVLDTSEISQSDQENTVPLSNKMKDIAERIHSEISFVLYENETKGLWQIPKGGAYSEEKPLPQITFPRQDKFILEMLSASAKTTVLDSIFLEHTIPDSLKRIGINSLIAVPIQPKKLHGLLFVCNSKMHTGRPGLKLSYELRDVQLAQFYANHFPTYGTIFKEPVKMNSMYAWTHEKPELLKTNPGWYVAYQDGKRIALAQSLTMLMTEIKEKLGVSHKPCEFHEIVAKPVQQYRQSPRLMPSSK
jgi:hypothetical protein